MGRILNEICQCHVVYEVFSRGRLLFILQSINHFVPSSRHFVRYLSSVHIDVLLIPLRYHSYFWSRDPMAPRRSLYVVDVSGVNSYSRAWGFTLSLSWYYVSFLLSANYVKPWCFLTAVLLLCVLYSPKSFFPAIALRVWDEWISAGRLALNFHLFQRWTHKWRNIAAIVVGNRSAVLPTSSPLIF